MATAATEKAGLALREFSGHVPRKRQPIRLPKGRQSGTFDGRKIEPRCCGTGRRFGRQTASRPFCGSQVEQLRGGKGVWNVQPVATQATRALYQLATALEPG